MNFAPTATTPVAFDVKVLSAEDLRLSDHSIKGNAFASISHKDSAGAWTTSICSDGGSYPRWSDAMIVSLPPSARTITAEVKCKTLTGVRLVGKAEIPVSDFHGGLFPANYLHLLSYRLRDEGGRRNGIINLAIRRRLPEPWGSAGLWHPGVEPAPAAYSGHVNGGW